MDKTLECRKPKQKRGCRNANVEITPNGINISLPLGIVIDILPDPALDVSFRITLAAIDGNAVANVVRLSTDVDLPWQVQVAFPGVARIVEEVVENSVRGALLPALVDQVRQFVADVAQVPPGFGIYSIDTDTDVINVTICPRS